MADALGGDAGESGGEVFAPEGVDEQSAPQPTKIAPIPDSKFARPKPSLGHEAIESVIEDSKAPKSAKYAEEMVEPKGEDKITRPRDESGRFLPASGKGEKTSFDVALDDLAEKGQEAEKAPTPTPTPVKFAGREFATQAEAESAFSNIEWHAQQAAKSAQEWKAYAESLRAGGPAVPASQPEPSKQVANQSLSFDVEQAQMVRELAIEAGKPELYDKWVIEENERVLNARLDARMAELQAPLIKQQQEQQLYTAVTNTWNSLGQFTKPDGSPAFPEVGNGQVEEQIGEYWAALGFTAEQMLTPAACMAAIALHRLMNGSLEGNSIPNPGTTVPTVQTPTDADGVVAGASRTNVAASEPEPASVRYLSNALNRSGYRIRGGNGQSIHLFDR